MSGEAYRRCLTTAWGLREALFPFPLARGRRARKGQINGEKFLKQVSVSASNGEEEKKGDSGGSPGLAFPLLPGVSKGTRNSGLQQSL